MQTKSILVARKHAGSNPVATSIRVAGSDEGQTGHEGGQHARRNRDSMLAVSEAPHTGSKECAYIITVLKRELEVRESSRE